MAVCRTSGIYKIICIANGKIYVGSSVNLQKRWISHRSQLRSNKHHCSHLQRTWNKYGEQLFIFEVIELTTPDILIDREQYWLDNLNPELNESLIAGRPSNSRHSCSIESRQKISNANKGRKHTLEELERMKVSHLGNKNCLGYKQTKEHIEKCRLAKLGKKNKPHSLETRMKIGLANKGKLKGRVLSDETKRKMSIGKQKRYIVIDPNGNEMPILGLKGFCQDNGLDISKMVAVANGRRSHHRNWKCEHG